jgi:hypothetical protein
MDTCAMVSPSFAGSGVADLSLAMLQQSFTHCHGGVE